MPGPPVPTLVNAMDAFTYACADGDHLFVAVAKIEQLKIVIGMEIPSGVVKIFTPAELLETVRTEPEKFVEDGGKLADLAMLGMPGGVHQPGAMHLATIGSEGPPGCGGGEAPSEFISIPTLNYTMQQIRDEEGTLVSLRFRGKFPKDDDLNPGSGFMLHTLLTDQGVDTELPIASCFVDGAPLATSAPPPKPPGTAGNIATKHPPLTITAPIAGAGEPGDPLIMGEVETLFGKLNNAGVYATYPPGHRKEGEEIQPKILMGDKMYSDLVDDYNAQLQRYNTLAKDEFEILLQPFPKDGATVQLGVLKIEEE